MPTPITCCGFNIEREICRYGITDIHDIWVIEQAAKTRPSDWTMVDAMGQHCSGATKHVLDYISRLLYHRDEYLCNML